MVALQGKKIMVCCDANAKSPLWHSTEQDSRGRILEDLEAIPLKGDRTNGARWWNNRLTDQKKPTIYRLEGVSGTPVGSPLHE